MSLGTAGCFERYKQISSLQPIPGGPRMDLANAGAAGGGAAPQSVGKHPAGRAVVDGFWGLPFFYWFKESGPPADFLLLEKFSKTICPRRYSRVFQFHTD